MPEPRRTFQEINEIPDYSVPKTVPKRRDIFTPGTSTFAGTSPTGTGQSPGVQPPVTGSTGKEAEVGNYQRLPTTTITPRALDDVVERSTVAAPPPPPQGAIPGVQSTSTLRQMTEVELTAFLEGIASRYGLTTEQLLLQENQLGIVARSLAQQLERAREEAVGAQQRASSERGILRSGIHAAGVGRIDTAVAQQAIAAAQQRQLAQSQIDLQRGALEGAQASEEAAARTASAAGLIEFEQGQTVADLLAMLPPVPNVPPAILQPPAPFVNPPLTPIGPGNTDIFGPNTPEQTVPDQVPAPVVIPPAAPIEVRGGRSGQVDLADLLDYLRRGA
jgi:hypothetical protein